MRDFSISPKPKSPKKNNLKLLFIFFLIIAGVFIARQIFSQKNQSENNLSLTKKALIKDSQTGKKTISQKELLEKLEQLLRNTQGSYSVYLCDLEKKEELGINEEMVLTAASVNKIPILAALYYLAGKGEIDLEKIIVLQKEDIQDYGTGSIRYASPGTPYSLKTLARLMMEQSDNTASFLLGTTIIGLERIQKIIDSWGLKQTDMVNNKTSAKDMGILLTKMYRGEITNPALTAEMLNFMDKTDFDDRIPAGLPENIKSYHKTGDEIGKIHDVGIIELPNGYPYYLGVLTTDITDEKKAKKIIAEISRLVFSYMEEKINR